MIQKTGIQRAVDKFDGIPAKLAEAVGGGVLRQHIEHWLKAGRVSAEKCPEVAAATGMSCEELNDRVNWALARETTPATGVLPVQPVTPNKLTAHIMAEAFKDGVIKDQRIALGPRRADDRARDAKLAAYEAHEASQTQKGA